MKVPTNSPESSIAWGLNCRRRLLDAMAIVKRLDRAWNSCREMVSRCKREVARWLVCLLACA